MKKCIYILLINLFAVFPAMAEKKCTSDIYIIFYATYQGKTGHIGIAVDNYKILVTDYKKQGKIKQHMDTVISKELTYYDMWPDEDEFSVFNAGKNLPAVYYKLPLHSGDEITLNTLYDKGLPHKENYPSDGILQVKTTWQQDQEMIFFLDSLINSKKGFNAQLFNCADFVRVALEKLLKVSLSSQEFVGTGMSTTPNKLYRTLRNQEKVLVIKNADEKASGSFIEQRILYKIVNNK
ncbi:MAG: hypothetical protein WBC06_12425 [Chitinophagaceae bacterium]